MHTNHSRSETCSDSNAVLITSLFYTFVGLTVIAFTFTVFGLGWFESTVTISDPPVWVQRGIKGLLKAVELLFLYKMLTQRSNFLCSVFALLQTVAVGFLPIGALQSVADAFLLVALPVIFRRDKLWAFTEACYVYLIMCIYGSLVMVARLGNFSLSHVYSFYAGIASVVDYKLFVVTLYLYTKRKGGVMQWMKCWINRQRTRK